MTTSLRNNTWWWQSITATGSSKAWVQNWSYWHLMPDQVLLTQF